MDPMMSAWGVPPGAAPSSDDSSSSGDDDNGPAPNNANALVAVGHVHNAEPSDSESEDYGKPPEEIGEADPAKCKVSGPGFAGAAAAAPVSLYFYAQDYFNRRLKQGGDEVTVIVRPSGPAAALAGSEIRATVVDNNNGTYTCSYQVPSKGNYQLNVELNGVPIAGSPFPVFFSNPMSAEEAAAQAAAAEASNKGGDGSTPEPSTNVTISAMAQAAQHALSGLGLAQQTEPIHRSLHVSNLSPQVSPEQLRTLFSITGKVQEFKQAGAGDMATYTVEFATVPEAVEALKMDGMLLGDRPLRIVTALSMQSAAQLAAGGSAMMGGVPLMIPNPLMPNQMIANSALMMGISTDPNVKHMQMQQMQAQMLQSTALAAQIAEMRSLARANAVTKGGGTPEQQQAKAAAAAAERLNKKFGLMAAATVVVPPVDDKVKRKSRSRSGGSSSSSSRSRSRSKDRRGKRRSRSRSRRRSSRDRSQRSRSRERRDRERRERERREREIREREMRERERAKEREREREREKIREREREREREKDRERRKRDSSKDRRERKRSRTRSPSPSRRSSGKVKEEKDREDGSREERGKGRDEEKRERGREREREDRNGHVDGEEGDKSKKDHKKDSQKDRHKEKHKHKEKHREKDRDREREKEHSGKGERDKQHHERSKDTVAAGVVLVAAAGVEGEDPLPEMVAVSSKSKGVASSADPVVLSAGEAEHDDAAAAHAPDEVIVKAGGGVGVEANGVLGAHVAGANGDVSEDHAMPEAADDMSISE